MSFEIRCPEEGSITRTKGKTPVVLEGEEINRYVSNTIIGPEEGAVLTPWVAIDFVSVSGETGEGVITVGNESSPNLDPNATAIIKSFSFGHTDGVTGSVVIHDIQGGQFEQFMHNLVSDWSCMKDYSGANLFARMQFGWAKSGVSAPMLENSSPCYYLFVRHIETNTADGKLVFEVSFQDTMAITLEGTVTENHSEMHLMDAIHKLCVDGVAPNISSVKIKLANKEDEDTGKKNGYFKASTLQEKIMGPIGKWDTLGKSKLDTVRAWLRTTLSINERSWSLSYNPEVVGGELIIWESSVPADSENIPKTDAELDESSLGTYVVNGGPYSSVIDFSPKVSWDFSAFGISGASFSDRDMNAANTEGGKNPDSQRFPKEQYEGAGTQTTNAPNDNVLDREGDDAVAENYKAIAAEKRNMNIYYSSITADLVIIGDPNICRPRDGASLARHLAIVYINPMYLDQDAKGRMEWLAQPAINPVFSNKNWIVKSVGHNIEAGRYTTTLTVNLPVPNSDLGPDANFGNWTNGWKPKNC